MTAGMPVPPYSGGESSTEGRLADHPKDGYLEIHQTNHSVRSSTILESVIHTTLQGPRS
jgi:hypothetical protein